MSLKDYSDQTSGVNVVYGYVSLIITVIVNNDTNVIAMKLE